MFQQPGVLSNIPASCLCSVSHNMKPQQLAVLVLHLSALSASCVPIVLQFIIRMSSVLISGMPKKACPFLQTTKTLQILSLLLCSIFTLYMPNCIFCCSVVCF